MRACLVDASVAGVNASKVAVAHDGAVHTVVGVPEKPHVGLSAHAVGFGGVVPVLVVLPTVRAVGGASVDTVAVDVRSAAVIAGVQTRWLPRVVVGDVLGAGEGCVVGIRSAEHIALVATAVVAEVVGMLWKIRHVVPWEIQLPWQV